MRKLLITLAIIGCTYSLSMLPSISYEKNVTVAKQVETAVLDGILEGNLPPSRGTDLEAAVLRVHNELSQLVEKNNALAETDSQKLTTRTAVQGGTDVYYFLDDTTSTTEQFFVLRAVGGKIFKLSIVWKDGKCYEIQQSTYY